MTEARIIQADFANWRPVSGRKVLQLIFEVPIEQTEQALKMLGVPMPGESKWCAIALLENGARAKESASTSQRQTQKPSDNSEPSEGLIGGTLWPTNASTAETGISETQGKERLPFASLPLSQQAGIRCSDPHFQDFAGCKNETEAVLWVRGKLGIASRSELSTNEIGARKWLDVEAAYQNWLTDKRYSHLMRAK